MACKTKKKKAQRGAVVKRAAACPPRRGTRRGPRDGSGPRGGTAACPVTRSKAKSKTTKKK